MSGWPLETLVATSLLMLLVLVVRGPVRRAFGARIGYALWALPALRMLLPPLPASWREAVVAPIARAEQIVYFVADPITVAAPDAPSLVPLLGLVWGVGAAVFLLAQLLDYRRFCDRVLRNAVNCASLGGAVALIESRGATGPVAFGVFRRYIAFPADFRERYGDEERALALAHELGDHRRGDLIANWAALAVLAIHWFNPIAWRAFRAFRADQEMACDALVLAGRSAEARHSYGLAIVKSIHGGALSAACHLHTINDVKGRLKMLKETGVSLRRAITGGLMVAALTLGGLSVTASGTAATARIAEGVGATIERAVPLPPTPPAPPAAVAQAAPPAPPAPATPPAPPAADDGVSRIEIGKGGTKRIRIIRAADGATIRDDLVSPEVVDLCRNGGSDTDTVTRDKDGREVRKRVICIRKAAAGAAMDAEKAQGIAVASKAQELDALREARAEIAAETEMTGEKRAQALASIDMAIASVEARTTKAE